MRHVPEAGEQAGAGIFGEAHTHLWPFLKGEAHTPEAREQARAGFLGEALERQQQHGRRVPQLHRLGVVAPLLAGLALVALTAVQLLAAKECLQCVRMHVHVAGNKRL